MDGIEWARRKVTALDGTNGTGWEEKCGRRIENEDMQYGELGEKNAIQRFADEILRTNICGRSLADTDLWTKVLRTKFFGRRFVDEDLRTKICVDEDLRYEEMRRRTFAETKFCGDEDLRDEDLQTKNCDTKKCRTKICDGIFFDAFDALSFVVYVDFHLTESSLASGLSRALGRG